MELVLFLGALLVLLSVLQLLALVELCPLLAGFIEEHCVSTNVLFAAS